MRKSIAFVGGGSGGHLYPQIAVADELKKIAPDIDLFFVSAKGSIDEKLIPKAGYSVILIPSGKLKGQKIIGLLSTMANLFLSVFVCLYWLLKRRPILIFSAGGYAGAPYLVVGSLLGIRCEIFEQNRIPGLANRLMARFCQRIYLNFSATKELLQGKELKEVGHPVRAEFSGSRWSEAEWENRERENTFKLFITGGSQGAMGLNRLVTAATKHFQGLNIEILHQTGEADFERVKKEYAENGFTNVRVEKFINNMVDAFRDADLVISRSGASSLAELAAAEKAAILIPLVSKDCHQEYNAQEMEKIGAGLCFLQYKMDGEKLASSIKEFYLQRHKLKTMAKKMGTLYRANAANAIAESLLKE